MRDAESKVDTKLSDADYTNLEALVTGKGIRLLGGRIIDDMVDI
ncbi:hypothetical protein FACS1894191_5650 [Clostridia bacterium]|nr:hypothetical protein FACS1894191_5650 [Clostridia bacterium]